MTEGRRDSFLTIYFVWPAATGLGLAAVLAIPTLGLGLLTGATWVQASRDAAIVAMVALPAGSVLTFLYAAGGWAGPRTLAAMTQPAPEISTPQPQPEVRFIPVTRNRPLRREPPQLPSNEGAHRGALSVMFGRLLAKPVREVSYEHQVEAVEPSAAPWVTEMYDVLCKTWSVGLSRRTFERLWPAGGKAKWRRYVGGNGTGRHAGKGILDVWGAIRQDGPRNTWTYCQTLDVIVSLDADLAAYAQARDALPRSPRHAESVREAIM